jgi:Protein of unknown function (DUF2829)
MWIEVGYKQWYYFDPQLWKEFMKEGIGWAVKQMHNGSKVARAGWNGKDMYLMLQVPDEHSKMTLPYVYIRTVQGDLVPWLCSQTDLLATDWMVVG